MSRSAAQNLWHMGRPCTQFFYLDKDGTLHEHSDPFFEDKDMLDYYNKWFDYWEKRGRKLFLIEHDRHPKKLEC